MVDVVRRLHKICFKYNCAWLQFWVTRRLFLTQILTQNGKNQCGQRSTNGKSPPQLPAQRASKGRFSTEKTPFPTLLSSRSGVRVPPGVPLQQTEYGGCSSIGRAPDCGSGRCGFESHYPPHKKKGYQSVSFLFICR